MILGAKTPSQADSSRYALVASLLIVSLGVLAYCGTVNAPFVFDDILAIVKNPQLRSLNPFANPSPLATTISGRPMLIFTFQVNYAIAKLNPPIYHVTNILIHIFCALLLYGIVRRTVSAPGFSNRVAPRSAISIALVITTLWVVHPLATQSVTYVAQRAESLASLFLLAVIYCLIRSIGGNLFWTFAVVITCACGMATKEIVAAAPVLALLYDRAFLAGSFKAALSRRWKIYAGMVLTWLFILYSLHTGRRGAMVGFHLDITPLDYARTELNVIAHYLRLAFWPNDLALDYADWPLARQWSDVGWPGWFVLGLVLLTAVALRFYPAVGFLGAVFFLILAPTSSFLPIKQEAAAEQRMYLPLAAVISLVVFLIYILVRGSRPLQRVTLFAAACLSIVLMSLTIARNRQYSSSLEIWTDTVAKRPNNARAHYNLGQEWTKLAAAQSPDSAEAQEDQRNAQNQFELAHTLDPGPSSLVFALGEAYEHAGDLTAAEDLYTRSIPQYPDAACDLFIQRGNLRARRQDWANARNDFLDAIKLNPGDVEAHYFLGVLCQQMGDLKTARQQLSIARQIDPHYKDTAARLSALQNSALSQ